MLGLNPQIAGHRPRTSRFFNPCMYFVDEIGWEVVFFLLFTEGGWEVAFIMSQYTVIS